MDALVQDGDELLQCLEKSEADVVVLDLKMPYYGLTALEKIMNQSRQETGRAPNDLSAREWEVIECTAKGMTNPEIAQSLGVSANTVLFYLKSIFSKMRVSNRTEAAAWYFAQKGK